MFLRTAISAQIPRAALILGLLAALAPAARAAERVTLTNGFIERCDHHARVDGRVRLYLSAGEDDYIELAPGEIASYEAVPNLPAAGSGADDGALSTRDGRLSAADLHQMLARAGERHNLDVDLLASIVKAESNGNARAVSRAGAEGLMQLMPGTAASLGVNNRFAPGQNIQGGAAYLDALLIRYGNNLALALAAYNAGPEAVDRYHGIPPYQETRAYVARVIHEFNRRVLAREKAARRMAMSRASSR